MRIRPKTAENHNFSSKITIFVDPKREDRELSLIDSDSASCEMRLETPIVKFHELRFFDANFATPTRRKRVLRTT